MYHGCDKITEKLKTLHFGDQNLISNSDLQKEKTHFRVKGQIVFLTILSQPWYIAAQTVFLNDIYSSRRIFLACFQQGNMHALVAIWKSKFFYGKGHRIVK